jgi:hypothetical protein
MRHTIEMGGLTSKVFSANYRRADTYHATIQNNTSQSLTITTTNQNILSDSTASYKQPASGALVVASGDFGELKEPYVGWLLSLSGAASSGETVDIVEAG